MKAARSAWDLKLKVAAVNLDLFTQKHSQFCTVRNIGIQIMRRERENFFDRTANATRTPGRTTRGGWRRAHGPARDL